MGFLTLNRSQLKDDVPGFEVALNYPIFNKNFRDGQAR